MRKFFILLSAAALAFSCQGVGVDRPASHAESTSALNVKVVEKSGPSTKADPSTYLESRNYERRINSIELLVFYRGGAQDGVLALSERLTNSDAVFSVSRSYDLAAGEYTVCAYVNGGTLSADQKASLAAFRAVPVALNENSVTETEGFVMSGEASATVGDTGTNSCEISLQRVLNRVVVNKITNSLASGVLTVNRIWLANIVTGQSVSNSVRGDDRVWAHQFSRAASPWTGSTLISSFTSPLLTSKSPAVEIANGGNVNSPSDYLLYAFANLNASGDAESSRLFLPASTVWGATKTRIVIETTINSSVYYYPYDLTLGARNQTNTLDFVISGLGLTDPQGDPGALSKQALDVSVSVADWVPGENKEIVY